MLEASTSRRRLMQQLADVRARLRTYRIRDSSHYAEELVAEALDGERIASGVNKGHDIVAPMYGRIEVKCRQLPPDGRMEERVPVSAAKEAGFDFLAIVIFHPDYTVKGAVMVPYASVWELVTAHRYNRISYPQACELRDAEDITGAVQAASER